jgi:hypothetical protein
MSSGPSSSVSFLKSICPSGSLGIFYNICMQNTNLIVIQIYFKTTSICIPNDKVWINDWTLIHKNIRSVRNLHAQELTDVKIIGQCDVTDKNNNVSFEDLDVHYH